MARLTFPDQQQDLQNAASASLASKCDGSVKFCQTGCGSRFYGYSAAQRGSGRLGRFTGVGDLFVPASQGDYKATATGASLFPMSISRVGIWKSNAATEWKSAVGTNRPHGVESCHRERGSKRITGRIHAATSGDRLPRRRWRVSRLSPAQSDWGRVGVGETMAGAPA